MTILCKDQLKIKSDLKDLIDGGTQNELPNILKPDQEFEILALQKYLLSLTTKRRRQGTFYQIDDYYCYFSKDDETIPEILSKLNPDKRQLEYLSKLLIKVNSQLYISDGQVSWFSKNDSGNFSKIKNIKLETDSLLLIPVAIPDPYIHKKRPAIPKGLRQLVWESLFNDSDQGNCYVCSKTIINENNGWHCAHIIPYIICKKHELNNLTVSCPTCNLQCGTLNLDYFKNNEYC